MVSDAVPPERMRVGDHDRESAMNTLRTAFEEGRLDLAEFNDRLSRVNEAGTFGELDVLTGDLPVTPARAAPERPPRRAEHRARPRRPEPDPADPAARTARRQALMRSGFIIVFLNFSAWLVLAINQGFTAVHPWWIWVAGGWGGVLLVHNAIRARRAEPPSIDEDHRRELDESDD
jgi:hypothetical protein